MSYRNHRPSAPKRDDHETPSSAEAAPTVAKAPVRSHVKHQSEKPTRSKWPLIGAILIALVVMIVAASWLMAGRSGLGGAIDSSKYQAVFFTNGQVYFGKLSPINNEYMRLKNVYYLQNKTQTTDGSSPQSASKQNASDVELIKLGNEIHGPEDEMLVAKDQVLFFENLKPAGTVSQTITNFQKKNQ